MTMLKCSGLGSWSVVIYMLIADTVEYGTYKTGTRAAGVSFSLQTDFENARAARITLGADKDGKPMLFWAEGVGKLGYIPGDDSRGAMLADMAEITADIGMVNGINLDGGGSAQILLKNKRSLKISDRNRSDNSEAERLVPMG